MSSPHATDADCDSRCGVNEALGSLCSASDEQPATSNARTSLFVCMLVRNATREFGQKPAMTRCALVASVAIRLALREHERVRRLGRARTHRDRLQAIAVPREQLVA